jgi:hypothetical protein
MLFRSRLSLSASPRRNPAIRDCWGTLGDAPWVLLSYPDLLEYRARSRSLEDLDIIGKQSVNLTGLESIVAVA